MEMDAPVAATSALFQLLWEILLFIWYLTASILLWALQICLLPFRGLWWITYPFRYTTGRIWSLSMGFIAWSMDEFEPVMLYLSVAIVVGVVCGLMARVVLFVCNAIFDAIFRSGDVIVKQEKHRESRSSRTPSSAESDYSFTEDDPLPPYQHIASLGKTRAAPGSLLRQTIHEEVEDSSS